MNKILLCMLDSFTQTTFAANQSYIVKYINTEQDDWDEHIESILFSYRTSVHHCTTAFSMQSCAESAYQPYADEYH